jgi:UDP-2,3-diacylglucosamine hydrolase
MQEDLGCEVHSREARLELDGKHVYLAHGDRVNPTPGNRVYGVLLRNRCTYAIMRSLGPPLVTRIARWLSSRSRSRRLGTHIPTRDRLRDFAAEKLREEFDVVILGHSHVPEFMTVPCKGGVGYYYNVGDWAGAQSYVEYSPRTGFSLEFYGSRRGHTEKGA